MLLQVRGYDGSLRLGDEDVYRGRCYGCVCGWVEWMPARYERGRGGTGRVMLNVYNETFSFLLSPRSPTPKVMRTATTLRERTRSLLRSTEVIG